jgi:leucyl-tRNA synthetase
MAEELWHALGNTGTVTAAAFPKWDQQYLTEHEFEYPVSVNGKVRFKMKLPLDLSKEEVEQVVLSSDDMRRFAPAPPKKVIVVPGRIVNVVT